MYPDIPLPSPPFVEIPGLHNFRDCGGYPIANTDGKKIIRNGVLFRASEPSRLTDDGIAILNHHLRITHVYDLRSISELSNNTTRPVKEWEGATRVFLPVFTDEDYSPEAIAKRYSSFASKDDAGFIEVYSRILEAGADPNGTQPFAAILRHLATLSPIDGMPPPAVLIHCTAGKDRTGVICALVLSLCGVPDEAVAHEYSLTDLGLKERKEEFVTHLIGEDPLRDNRPAAERMVSSRKESMLGTLELIREKYGGTEAFIKNQCGLSEEEVQQIRENLIVEADDEQEPVAWEEHRKML